MLNSLSGAKRSLVGRLVALAYLVCVLAPSSALAIGDGRLSEHCLFDDGLLAAFAYQGANATAAHASAHHDHLSHSAGPMHVHHHDGSMAGKPVSPEPSRHGHQAIDLQCCGMLCVAALPASISDVVIPCPTLAFALRETGGHFAGNLPSLHYRPPIA